MGEPAFRMSSTATPLGPPAAAQAGDEAPPEPDGWRDGQSRTLSALRDELDRLDDALHDLLMERARVVERVAQSGKRSALRPGRQAAIMRRLVTRHTGMLPVAAVVRMWQEMLAGTTAMQTPFSLAVCAPGGDSRYVQVARENFGALTPLRVHASAAHAVAEVRAGSAVVAVLPVPSDTEEPREAWWMWLLRPGTPAIQVVARLPLWAPRPEGAPDVEALVVAAAKPDASGLDRSLIGLELSLDVSRARLGTMLAAARLAPTQVILRRDPGAPVADALVEVEGFVTEDDPRLAEIGLVLQRPVVLGAYAVPLEGVGP